MSGTWTYNGGSVFTPSPENPDIATQADLDAHAVDATSVHGISDTSALALASSVTVEASARATADTTHEADTTNVHGIADTSALALTASVQPLDSDLTAFAALSPSNDDLAQRKAGAWTNRTPSQVKSDLVLVKGDVGLGNVDNTADTAKPVSTAQQTALDAKQPLNANLTAVAAGTYTPTLTNIANVDASTAFQCQYMRVGSMVTVSGKVSIDATTTNALTRLGLSLPVASNFAAAEDCGGCTGCSEAIIASMAVIADPTNDRAELSGPVGASTARVLHFIFMYEVI